MKTTYNQNKNPRVIVIQKLYSKNLNNDQLIEFPKHRFKKFIKDVVLGTLERKEYIQETINTYLNNDLDIKRTEKIIILLLHAAIFELLYKPQVSVNIIINEYLNASNSFIDENQKKFLNALLDKVSKKIRNNG
tara:strand:+ start:42 stop:443 length:402 start_codon:yes stop_codon:yes gene_type:complete